MASDNGEPQQLTICTGTDRDTVFVEVSDTGDGLSADDFDRLFQPFFTRKPNGLGLGLSISRSIIEAHLGELTARRNTGCGMTFLFTLPIARKAANAVDPAEK
jgi:signal transduction histidine kinase